MPEDNKPKAPEIFSPLDAKTPKEQLVEHQENSAVTEVGKQPESQVETTQTPTAWQPPEGAVHIAHVELDTEPGTAADIPDIPEPNTESHHEKIEKRAEHLILENLLKEGDLEAAQNDIFGLSDPQNPTEK